MKDHELRELVTNLCGAAGRYATTEHLRDRMAPTLHPLMEENRKLRETAKKAAQWMDATCPGAGCEQPYYKVLADLKEALE